MQNYCRWTGWGQSCLKTLKCTYITGHCFVIKTHVVRKTWRCSVGIISKAWFLNSKGYDDNVVSLDGSTAWGNFLSFHFSFSLFVMEKVSMTLKFFSNLTCLKSINHHIVNVAILSSFSNLVFNLSITTVIAFNKKDWFSDLSHKKLKTYECYNKWCCE